MQQLVVSVHVVERGEHVRTDHHGLPDGEDVSLLESGVDALPLAVVRGERDHFQRRIHARRPLRLPHRQGDCCTDR